MTETAAVPLEEEEFPEVSPGWMLMIDYLTGSERYRAVVDAVKNKLRQQGKK